VNLPTYTKVAGVDGDLNGADILWEWEWSGDEHGIPGPNVIPDGNRCVVTNSAIAQHSYVNPNSGTLTLTPSVKCGDSDPTKLDPIALSVGLSFVEPVQPCCKGGWWVNESCGISNPVNLALVDGEIVVNGVENLTPENIEFGVGILLDNGLIRVRTFGWPHCLSLGGSRFLYNEYDTEAYDFAYDQTGTGNYGWSDYLSPGNPSEELYFQVRVGDKYYNEINNKEYQCWNFLCSEGYYHEKTECYSRTDPTGTVSYYADEGDEDTLSYPITVWKLGDNRVVGFRKFFTHNNEECFSGAVLVEYYIRPGIPVLQMRHSFVFNVDVDKLVVGRGTDPDPDLRDYDTYDTYIEIGLGTIPPNKIAVSYGAITGKPMAIFAPGNGYTVNAASDYGWHDWYQMELNGSYCDSHFADNSIDVFWEIENIPAGQPVVLCAYYACGVNADELVQLFGAC
jgi:hypothetical protein